MDKIETIILDTETTGFKDPQPVEVAYISLTGLEDYPKHTLVSGIHPVYSERFKPTKRIDAGAVQVHGITLEDVKDKPVFTLQHMNLPDSVSYIIGHNISYDWRVLGKPEHLGLGRICTLKLSKKLWPGLESYKLVNLMKEFFPGQHEQITKNAHGAEVDCRLVLALLTKAKLEFEIKTWEDFYDITGQGR